MFLTTLLLVGCAAARFVCASDSFRIPVHRKSVDTSTGETSKSGIIVSKLDRSLYWYGNFSVGDSHNLKLLIDTGSTDLIVNPGLYKPSKNVSHFQGHQNFTISYEGVSRAGYGFETMKGTMTRDLVTAGGLTVANQAIGSITSFKYIDTRPLPYAVQDDGNIGFAVREGSGFVPESNSWFFNLCKDKVISECRLGLAYGTNNTGVTIIGSLASDLIDGPLTVAPGLGPFWIKGDVAIDNKIIATDQTFNMDVGTDNIQGPIRVTKKIFDILGYQSVEMTGPNLFEPKIPAETLLGFFPCDEPPTLGFSFPAQGELKKGEKSTIFNVLPAVWDVYNHGNNNCTSILGGTNSETNPKNGYGVWLLGQPFFAGHYLDFDVTSRTIGFGNLKNPAG